MLDKAFQSLAAERRHASLEAERAAADAERQGEMLSELVSCIVGAPVDMQEEKPTEIRAMLDKAFQSLAAERRHASLEAERAAADAERLRSESLVASLELEARINISRQLASSVEENAHLLKSL